MNIPLWQNNAPGYMPGDDSNIETPYISDYLLQNGRQNNCIIICPGGGYSYKSIHEGEPVAKWLNTIGLSSFVLNYRTFPYKYPYPLLDGKRAIRYVRSHAAEWSINPQKIAVLGFSAGGHLAGMLGTKFDYGNTLSTDPVECESSRPDALVLCYPVITSGEYRHKKCFENLLGESPAEKAMYKLSIEHHTVKDMPPVFLWHTTDDKSVPVENSILFAQALSKIKIPFELHIFPEGRHGLGLAQDKPGVAVWTTLCESWFKKTGFI